jgi:hypothetical protein
MRPICLTSSSQDWTPILKKARSLGNDGPAHYSRALDYRTSLRDANSPRTVDILSEGCPQFLNDWFKLRDVFRVDAFRGQRANLIFESAGAHGTNLLLGTIAELYTEKAVFVGRPTFRQTISS